MREPISVWVWVSGALLGGALGVRRLVDVWPAHFDDGVVSLRDIAGLSAEFAVSVGLWVAIFAGGAVLNRKMRSVRWRGD
ncbi:MAG: hypothetical protein O2895_02320 [Chloroflexi bacterium]|nr:hypothetical protein [Chloroflexota bacterium]